MSELLAKCTNARCNAVFSISNFINIGSGASITVTDCGATCPRCGSIARILDGTFSGAADGKPVLQSGPPETAAAVAMLRKIIADAKAGKDAEEIVRELEERSSKLGAVARNIVARKGLTFLIIAISYLLAACDAKLEMKLDWNVMADQLYHYATGRDPYPGLTGVPKPQAAAQSEKPEDEQLSEPEQTSSLKPQPSHHKSRRSKRQKRRSARPCVLKQK